MKTYDMVIDILKYDEASRNSDKRLMFIVWQNQGLVDKSSDGKPCITYDELVEEAISPESITRARRKIQETNPELAPTNNKVLRRRKAKRDTKGTFIYRENIEEGIYK